MSFTPVPFTLPVRVKIEGDQLAFDDLSVLVKYLKAEELLVSDKAAQCGPGEPYSKVVDVRRTDGIVDDDRKAGRDKLDPRWWSIQDVASLSGRSRDERHIERRVAKLSFDGQAYTQALRGCTEGPDLALYEAFLEGGILELDVFISERDGQQATAPLILKLALNYV